jgi:hypothetical protein
MSRQYQQPAGSQRVGQEFHTKSGLVGWLDRNPRGYVSLELSFHARRNLARENMSRLVTAEIQKYMV